MKDKIKNFCNELIEIIPFTKKYIREDTISTELFSLTRDFVEEYPLCEEVEAFEAVSIYYCDVFTVLTLGSGDMEKYSKTYKALDKKIQAFIQTTGPEHKQD